MWQVIQRQLAIAIVTCVSIQENSHSNVIYVTSPLHRSVITPSICVTILAKCHSRVTYVTSPSKSVVLSTSTCVSIRVKSHSHVIYVTSHSHISVISPSTCASILENSYSVWFMWKVTSDIREVSPCTCVSMRGKYVFACEVCVKAKALYSQTWCHKTHAFPLTKSQKCNIAGHMRSLISFWYTYETHHDITFFTTCTLCVVNDFDFF